MYDAIIIGAGHNGLVAACYLGMAGKKVLMLEKNDYIGGATTSQQVFPDFEARLSRYSYLVSLFPQKIMDELGLKLNLFPRKIASYTPYDTHKGLIISNIDEKISKKSILALGFGESEWQGYQQILQKGTQFAELVWDSFMEPLKSKSDWEQYFNAKNKSQLWREMVEEPIGKLIEKHIESDILRGVMLTDGKIGAYTHAHDESLLQNRTYIYHIVGNKTGEWRVPQGGMGNLANQLIEKAISIGVEIRLNSKVIDIQYHADYQAVNFENDGKVYELKSKKLLFNSSPQSPTLSSPQFSNRNVEPSTIQKVNEGTAFKINMLLEKLPRLKDRNVSSEDAFAGTFHINESYFQMQKTFDEASAGKIPSKLAGEIYCHTLTDKSILSTELQAKGFHTLTYFGLDLPYSLFIDDNENAKKEVVSKFLSGINEYLDEPLENCLAKDKNGLLCLEAKSSLDLEKELGMPRGNIFHKGLSWFFAENEAEKGSFGVETDNPNVLICGSSAKRGGAVSGITGRNAAMKLLKDKR
jgi:phytoene dehydrogenase-like protein